MNSEKGKSKNKKERERKKQTSRLYLHLQSQVLCMSCVRNLINNQQPRNVKNIEKHEHAFGKSHVIFTLPSSFEEYYHLCNNSCGGVIWTCAKSTETCETSWDVKEINMPLEQRF